MDYSGRHQRFRERLRQIRVEANLSQVELAEKLGRTQIHVSEVEQGERRMANGEWRMANGEWRMANGGWRMDFLETIDFYRAYDKDPKRLLAALLEQTRFLEHDSTQKLRFETAL